MTAVEILPPGADEEKWLAARREGIGASEIAAVLGLSPWESPFSLYHRKANGWEMADAEHLEAGRRAEEMIALWFRDRMDTGIRAAGLYRHVDRPWQLATPDRLVLDEATGEVVATLECKHPYSWDGFGEDGTDDIPVYYRAQKQWQIDTLGLDVGYLAAYTQHQLRIFPIRRDERDLAVMRDAGRRFMDRIANGVAPDLDDHHATITTLKRLHPSVEDVDVEVAVELAEGYRRARALKSRAESLVDRFEARVRAAIGTGRRAMHNGKLVASRSVFDTDRIDIKRLRDERPDIAADFPATSTTDRLNPGRSKTYA